MLKLIERIACLIILFGIAAAARASDAYLYSLGWLIQSAPFMYILRALCQCLVVWISGQGSSIPYKMVFIYAVPQLILWYLTVYFAGLIAGYPVLLLPPGTKPSEKVMVNPQPIFDVMLSDSFKFMLAGTIMNYAVSLGVLWGIFRINDAEFTPRFWLCVGLLGALTAPYMMLRGIHLVYIPLPMIFAGMGYFVWRLINKTESKIKR